VCAAYKGIGGLLNVMKVTKAINFEDIRKKIKITKVVLKDGTEYLQDNLTASIEADTDLVVHSNFQEVLAESFKALCPECQEKNLVNSKNCARCQTVLPDLPIDPDQNDNKNFTLVFDHDGLDHVVFRNPTLFARLQIVSEQHQAFKKSKSPVKASDLYQLYPKISDTTQWKFSYRDWDTYNEFIDIIKPHFEAEREKIADILVKNKGLMWDHLSLYFSPGARLVAKDWDRDCLLGAICKSIKTNVTMFGNYFSITYECIQTSDAGFFVQTFAQNISEYSGVKSLDDLPCKLLTDDEYQVLLERGKKFAEFGKDPKHLFYKGPMLYKQWMGMERKHIDSRIMVDVVSFNRSNANYQIFQYRANSQRPGEKYEKVREEDYWRCCPTVPAFCLTTMRWGEVMVEKLEEIKFNENALDRLVLPQERKDIIKALISHPPQFQDIVEGKSQGRIFLLHGPPGVGKTSSAEAVAEVLKLPLYKFTSGQLGVQPSELDTRLRDRLMIADRWKAIILLDEADIYLERRKDSDVLRNAMVSIFLNLLEYHQGVLFLTTNRVNCFDDAFQSRINLTLNYEEFDTEIREKVWLKQLTSAGLDLKPETQWLTHNMNGRQIGNCIRMAMSIAMSKAEKVSNDHLETAMRYGTNA